MKSGIIYEDDKLVSICVGTTKNRKTGNIPQIYILLKDKNPVEAVKDGSDKAICGDCPLRGTGNKDRGCYVLVFMGPRQVWEAYKRGYYKKLKLFEFKNKIVRLASYGEMAFLPVEVTEEIQKHAKKTLGYTHAWRYKPEFAGKLMASVESIEAKEEANKNGWKTFRIVNRPEDKLDDEIICPASKEGGYSLTCERCGICNGKRKNVAIVGHGSEKYVGKNIKKYIK